MTNIWIILQVVSNFIWYCKKKKSHKLSPTYRNKKVHSFTQSDLKRLRLFSDHFLLIFHLPQSLQSKSPGPQKVGVGLHQITSFSLSHRSDMWLLSRPKSGCAT